MNPLVAVLLNVLLIAGIWNLFGPGMLLHWLVPTLEKLPKEFQKPLYACPACMASIYGSLFFILVIKGDFCLLPLHCLAVSGATTLLFDAIYHDRD